MLGCKSTNLDAAVDSAGGFVIQDEHTPQRPVSPIDMLSSLSCPLMALFGEEDPNPSPEHAARLQEELDKHGKTYTFHMYRDAGHAFFADYRPSYRAAPAQDMWHRVMLFYDRHLKV
jgi:carboxymethylenebutenolidase